MILRAGLEFHDELLALSFLLTCYIAVAVAFFSI